MSSDPISKKTTSNFRDAQEYEAWETLRNAASRYAHWIGPFEHLPDAGQRPANYTQPGWKEYKALVDAALTFAATSHHDTTRFGRGYYAGILDAAEDVEDSGYASGPALSRISEHVRLRSLARGMFEPLENATAELVTVAMGHADLPPSFNKAIGRAVLVLAQLDNDRKRPRGVRKLSRPKRKPAKRKLTKRRVSRK